MRVRTYAEIKEHVIESFRKDYPGETIHNCPFSVYVLDIYCRLVETHDLYRRMVRNNDLDL